MCLAGSLLPEILLTAKDPVYPTTDPVYPIHKISTNVVKSRQMSTTGRQILTLMYHFSRILNQNSRALPRISRIFLNSRVFPGFAVISMICRHPVERWKWSAARARVDDAATLCVLHTSYEASETVLLLVKGVSDISSVQRHLNHKLDKTQEHWLYSLSTMSTINETCCCT